MVHDDRPTDSLEIMTGVRQGCIMLSPFLFILKVNLRMEKKCMRKINCIPKTSWLQLDDLDFADEVALNSYTHD